jgi:hypothetical protein
MKSVKVLLGIIVIALSMSSCKNNVELIKRHYTKGYFFHKSKSVKQSPSNDGIANKATKRVIVPVATVRPEVSPAPANKTMSRNENTMALPSAASATKISTPKSAAIKEVQTENEDKTITETKNKKNSERHLNTQRKGSLSGGTLVLCIILALFPLLCLIAVYIHDGKSITFNFWLTLILHLTIIGAMIYALLVVLDVVDLA